jgi:hypothetical protein
MQIEHEHSEQDGQHLFDIRYRDPPSVSRKRGGHGSVKRTGHSHAQRSRFLVRRETDNVQPESDAPVCDQPDGAKPSHLVGAPVPNILQLPADPRVKHALDERQRAHPSQQVKRVHRQSWGHEVQRGEDRFRLRVAERRRRRRTRLEDIRKDSLESGEECAEERENETPCREIIVSIRAAGLIHQTGSYQIIGVATDARATPSITGMRLSILRVVNLLPNIMEDNIIVKIGVAARTTWWNW